MDPKTLTAGDIIVFQNANSLFPDQIEDSSSDLYYGRVVEVSATGFTMFGYDPHMQDGWCNRSFVWEDVVHLRFATDKERKGLERYLKPPPPARPRVSSETLPPPPEIPF